MSSFTSASQHYTDYRNMPMIIGGAFRDNGVEAIAQDTEVTLATSVMAYEDLISAGVPKEEARQVLPNASAVNLLWTVNARSLIGFFEQRLCRRNVREMQMFALKIWEVIHNYWQEYADCLGPYCYPSGKCNQGRMTCGKPYTPKQETTND